MITIKGYVEGIFRDVPESTEKENIMQEITQNLEEKVQDLIEAGKTQEDAINKSIVDFGDASEIKRDLMQAGGTKQTTKKAKNYTNSLWFSIWATALITAFFLFLNFYYTPHTIWFVYLVFGVLWWPLTMVFKWLNNRK